KGEIKVLLLFIVLAIIWVISFFIMLTYVNLHVLKKRNDKNRFLQKRNHKLKDFIEKDSNLNGRRIFAIIVGATIITALIFTILSLLIFASQQSIISTLIVTLILVSIGYWIGSKFVKSLAYQLFDKK